MQFSCFLDLRLAAFVGLPEVAIGNRRARRVTVSLVNVAFFLKLEAVDALRATFL
jgi:hypothetical protein